MYTAFFDFPGKNTIKLIVWESTVFLVFDTPLGHYNNTSYSVTTKYKEHDESRAML